MLLSSFQKGNSHCMPLLLSYRVTEDHSGMLAVFKIIFRRFLSNFSGSTGNSERNYISFESPHMDQNSHQWMTCNLHHYFNKHVCLSVCPSFIVRESQKISKLSHMLQWPPGVISRELRGSFIQWWNKQTGHLPLYGVKWPFWKGRGTR